MATPPRIKKFEHYGFFVLHSAYHTQLSWQQEDGGEIKFKIFGDPAQKNKSDNQGVSVGELIQAVTSVRATQEQKDLVYLEIVNNIAAHYRPHAMPDENNYHAVSPGIDEYGRLFVNVNNERRGEDCFSDRGCAETNLKGTYQRETGIDNPQFDVVYLQSGVATKQISKKDGKAVLKDKESGHIACLCGECRANWRDHAQRFVLIPTNGGNARLTLRKITSVEQLNELMSHPRRNEALEVPAELMYPLKKTHSVDMYPDILRRGYEYICDEDKEVVPIKTPSTNVSASDIDQDGFIRIKLDHYQRLTNAYSRQDMSVPALEEAPTLANINAHLQHLIRDTRHGFQEKIGRDTPFEALAVVIQADNGKFYDSRLPFNDQWISSKPSAYVTALSNMGNTKGIKNIWVVPFDEQQIKKELFSQSKNNQLTHTYRMPNPSELGRLIKNMKDTDSPNIHIIPPNDCTLSENELKSVVDTLNVRDAFGPQFSNPKKIISKDPVVAGR